MEKRFSPDRTVHWTVQEPCWYFRDGVEVNVIRAWLGHVSLDTTNRYAEITLRTKQAAVAACLPPVDLPAEYRPAGGWRKDADLIKWLDSL